YLLAFTGLGRNLQQLRVPGCSKCASWCHSDREPLHQPDPFTNGWDNLSSQRSIASQDLLDAGGLRRDNGAIFGRKVLSRRLLNVGRLPSSAHVIVVGPPGGIREQVASELQRGE